MQDRRANRPDEATSPAVEQRGGLWFVRSMDQARQVLRARERTTQAGFTAEFIPQARMRHRPILINDGPVHDEQRRKLGRFFAPTQVEQRYRGLVEQCADERLGQIADGQHFDLADLTLQFTVEVTGEIVGLTTTRRGDTPQRRRRRIAAMAHRLENFFRQPPFDLSQRYLGRTRREWLQAGRYGLSALVSFWLRDVRPAVRQRRRHPSDDVISHLVEQGYSPASLLVEALTYGTAGMVTTREFICMAAWHLIDDADLKAQYLAADQPGRIAILHELIRLEPVVGHLYRRATGAIRVDGAGGHAGADSAADDTAGAVADQAEVHTIEAGDPIDICVRAANSDPEAVGPDPLRLCPGRQTTAGPAGLSFGDGAHKCPGQPLAMFETDVLLTKLLARDPVIVREPTLTWDELIAGYCLRDFQVELRRPA